MPPSLSTHSKLLLNTLLLCMIQTEEKMGCVKEVHNMLTWNTIPPAIRANATLLARGDHIPLRVPCEVECKFATKTWRGTPLEHAGSLTGLRRLRTFLHEYGPMLVVTKENTMRYIAVAVEMTALLASLGSEVVMSLDAHDFSIALHIVDRLLQCFSDITKLEETSLLCSQTSGVPRLCFKARLLLGANKNASNAIRVQVTNIIHRQMMAKTVAVSTTTSFASVWRRYLDLCDVQHARVLIHMTGIISELTWLTMSPRLDRHMYSHTIAEVVRFQETHLSNRTLDAIVNVMHAMLSKVTVRVQETSPLVALQHQLSSPFSSRKHASCLLKEVSSRIKKNPHVWRDLIPAYHKCVRLFNERHLQEEVATCQTQAELYTLLQGGTVKSTGCSLRKLYQEDPLKISACMRAVLHRANELKGSWSNDLISLVAASHSTFARDDVCLREAQTFLANVFALNQRAGGSLSFPSTSRSFGEVAALAAHGNSSAITELVHHDSGAGLLLRASLIDESSQKEFCAFVRKHTDLCVNEIAMLTTHCFLRGDSSVTVDAVMDVMLLGRYQTFCAWALVFLQVSGHVEWTLEQSEFVSDTLRFSTHPYSLALWAWYCAATSGEIPIRSHRVMSHPPKMIRECVRCMSRIVESCVTHGDTAPPPMLDVSTVVNMGYIDTPFLWWLVCYVCNTKHFNLHTLKALPCEIARAATFASPWCIMASPYPAERKIALSVLEDGLPPNAFSFLQEVSRRNHTMSMVDFTGVQ